MVQENTEGPRRGPRQESEVKPNSRIGLSLSLCVRDILEGKIKEEEVKQIFANPKYPPVLIKYLRKSKQITM